MKKALWKATLLAGGLIILLGCGQGYEPAREETVPAEPAAQVAPAVAPTATQPSTGPSTAKAVIEGKSESTLSGTADFMMHGDQLMITLRVENAPPGEHAVHIHETGDCSAPDATSAGGHFNPGGKVHGAPDAPEHHAGDLGNMTVAEDGTGTAVIHSSELTLAPGVYSVMGRALVVHEKADDFATQPTGAAGGRIGCGVIEGP